MLSVLKSLKLVFGERAKALQDIKILALSKLKTLHGGGLNTFYCFPYYFGHITVTIFIHAIHPRLSSAVPDFDTLSQRI